MSILSRPKLNPQQRFDLEDFNALLSAMRTDSKLWTKSFLSNKNLILNGLEVSGLGLSNATVSIADSALIIPQGTTDFSYFVASPTASTELIPSADLVDNSRNYIEVELCNEDGTPLEKAFWNPDANSGVGEEFTQEVNTITNIKLKFTARTGGFSGDVNKIPVAIVDVSSAGNIELILDRRELFGRLGTPSNPGNEFTWGSQEEASISLTLSGVVGTFAVGETVTIGSETAKVTVGGTTAISVNEISSINISAGDTVTGDTSGATGVLVTGQESFAGADKNLNTIEETLKALMTEVKRIKGTDFWYQDQKASIESIISFADSIIVQEVINAKYAWDGSELSITTDAAGADADVLGRIRQMGKDRDIDLTRQDSASGTAIPVGEKQVIFIKIPELGSRAFSGVGSADTNYQTVAIEDFEVSDENYWLAYRENGLLYVRGYGELETGEETPLSDPDKESILALVNSVNPVFNAQDRSLQLIEGGELSLNDAGTDLVVGDISYIQVPGLTKERNTIAAQTIVLPNVDSVAYVEINRDTGAADTLTVTVSDMDAVTPGVNTYVIARRVTGGVIFDKGILVPPGEKVVQYFTGNVTMKASDEVVFFRGATDYTLLDPANFKGKTLYLYDELNNGSTLIKNEFGNDIVSPREWNKTVGGSFNWVIVQSIFIVGGYTWVALSGKTVEEVDPNDATPANGNFEDDASGWTFTTDQTITPNTFEVIDSGQITGNKSGQINVQESAESNFAPGDTTELSTIFSISAGNNRVQKGHTVKVEFDYLLNNVPSGPTNYVGELRAIVQEDISGTEVANLKLNQIGSDSFNEDASGVEDQLIRAEIEFETISTEINYKLIIRLNEYNDS